MIRFRQEVSHRIVFVIETLEFRVKPGVNGKADMLRFEEGRVENGSWIPGRVFNGDEKMNLRFGDMPGTLMVELYTY